MSIEICFSNDVSLGLKTENSSIYGEGFNCRITGCFTWAAGFERKAAQEVWQQVMAEIDHRHLGLDVRFDHTKDLSGITSWLVERLKDAPLQRSLKNLRLERGDGFAVLYGVQDEET